LPAHIADVAWINGFCGAEFYRLAEGGKGLIKALLLLEEQPKVVVRRGVTGIDLEGFSVPALSLFELVALRAHPADVAWVNGFCGAEFYRLAEGGKGLIKALLLLEEQPKAVVGLGVTGIDLEGFSVPALSLFELVA